MKVNELIKLLQKVYDENGNCQVMIDDLYAERVTYDENLSVVNIKSY